MFGVFLLTSNIHTILDSIHTKFPLSLLAETNLVSSFQLFTNTVFDNLSASPTACICFIPTLRDFQNSLSSSQQFLHHCLSCSNSLSTPAPYWFSSLPDPYSLLMSHSYQLPCLLFSAHWFPPRPFSKFSISLAQNLALAFQFQVNLFPAFCSSRF